MPKTWIIGGGVSALAAAFELTDEGRVDPADVTILQPGWRLGGKCASGRTPDPQRRIEEHGLHIWFGCYDNAFWLMRRCFDELKRDPTRHAQSTLEAAFEPCDAAVLWQYRSKDWSNELLNFPPARRRPVDFAEVVHVALTWALDRFVELESEHPDKTERRRPPARDTLAALDVFFEPDADPWRIVVKGVVKACASEAQSASADLLDDLVDSKRATQLLDVLADHVHSALSHVDLDAHPRVRFYVDTVDVLITILRGTLREHLLRRGFDTINDRDLADWLREHGLPLDREHPVQWPAVVRGVYAGCFAFEDGNTQRPRMAAGRALQGAVRTILFYGPTGITNRPGDGPPHAGNVLYRMQAGMGETVIAPLYEALRERGVDVRFFHAVSAVRADASGTRIAQLEVIRQVKVHSSYKPLHEVPTEGKLHLTAWSTEPPWAAMPDADALIAAAGDRHTAARALEEQIDPFPAHSSTLTFDIGEKDTVILAVPPGVQRMICADLIARDPAYATMLKSSKEVMTQALQLWLEDSAKELGQYFESNSLMSSYVEPWDTYCDMSHLLKSEGGGEKVQHLAYFCGVLPHAGVASQADADAAAQASATLFRGTPLGRVWPERSEAHRSGVGVTQFVRANWSPSERYSLTMPGSVEHRLKACGTRFGNLVLAGDWTVNGIDAGCVEAAVTSGMCAANAICGGPALDHIRGLDGPAGFPNRPPEAQPRSDVDQLLEPVRRGFASLFARLANWIRKLFRS